MSSFRIALANLRFPATRDESVALAEEAIAGASAAGAGLVVFPECFIPGYRAPGKHVPDPDQAFLTRAWSAAAAACARAGIVAVVGTERFVGDSLRLTALVIDADGSTAGFQDKVQLDPSEEGRYTAGAGRRLFHAGHDGGHPHAPGRGGGHPHAPGPLTFGVVICHEGWRYPETVRWAARRGAQLVVHPHFGEREPGGYVPTTFADPANTFHEKAVLCRAAENTCYVASVNCASPGSPTTSAIARPDGSLLAHQPYGEHGLLVADIDLAAATGLLASRCKAAEYDG
jgi:predicted amidohydrolase